MSAQLRCCELSERAGEPLGATATYAENWLVVEVPGTWSRDVARGEGLPAPVRATLGGWLDRTPASRLLFVRRPGRARPGARLVFVVRAAERDPEVRRLELASLDELADVDLAAAGEVSADSLVLVCGHGTRDTCCAVRGTAVYHALAPRLGPEELWISSHHGGHRFAANVLVLPAGVHLGRVPVERAPSLVDRALAGEVVLSTYRGRTAYPASVQAAERAVRERESLDSVSDLTLLAVEDDAVRFRGDDGRELVAMVERVDGPVVPASCGAEPESQPVLRARVL